MADNTVATFATDDIGGTHYPRVKLTHGADGEAKEADQPTPVPVQAVVRSDALFMGSVSATPLFALISASSSSTVTIVAAQTSARMRVLSYVLNAKATTSVRFNSSVTPLTGMMEFDQYGGAAAPFSFLGQFQTATGQPLTITTGAGAVAGHLVYVPVSVT
jgi:hypothetical protein